MEAVYETLAELEARPTLHSGHFDNLKAEGADYRVWLSRMTVADGMPYNNQVTLERLIKGRWQTVETREAK